TAGWGMGLYLCPGADQLLDVPLADRPRRGMPLFWMASGLTAILLGACIIGEARHRYSHAESPADAPFTEILTLDGRAGEVSSVAVSPDGRLIASGCNKVIRIWERHTGREVQTLRGHTGPVMSVDFSRHGDHLASGSLDGTACIWDVDTGRVHRKLT